MGKILLVHLCILFSSLSYAQDYTYSFEGELTMNDQHRIIEECQKVAHVDIVKLKYKEDSKRGELIIWTRPALIIGEVESSFSPADIKSQLVNMGLAPLSFTNLNVK